MGRILRSAEQVMDLERRFTGAPRAERPSPGSGPVAVRMDGVRFTHGGHTEPTLDGPSLTIPAGQSLAVVQTGGWAGASARPR